MQAAKRIEKKMIEYVMHKGQSVNHRIANGVRRKNKNVTDAEIRRRAYYLQKVGIFEDLDRFEDKPVWIVTEEFKQLFEVMDTIEETIEVFLNEQGNKRESETEGTATNT